MKNEREKAGSPRKHYTTQYPHSSPIGRILTDQAEYAKRMRVIEAETEEWFNHHSLALRFLEGLLSNI